MAAERAAERSASPGASPVLELVGCLSLSLWLPFKDRQRRERKGERQGHTGRERHKKAETETQIQRKASLGEILRG